MTIGFVTSAAPASPSSLLRGNNLIKWAFWVEVGGEEWNSVTGRNCITKMCVSFHCSQYREREEEEEGYLCWVGRSHWQYWGYQSPFLTEIRLCITNVFACLFRRQAKLRKWPLGGFSEPTFSYILINYLSWSHTNWSSSQWHESNNSAQVAKTTHTNIFAIKFRIWVQSCIGIFTMKLWPTLSQFFVCLLRSWTDCFMNVLQPHNADNGTMGPGLMCPSSGYRGSVPLCHCHWPEVVLWPLVGMSGTRSVRAGQVCRWADNIITYQLTIVCGQWYTHSLLDTIIT